MTTDWKRLAEARNLDISPDDLRLIVPILASLEAAYRPLFRHLRHDAEPAIVLSEAAVLGE